MVHPPPAMNSCRVTPLRDHAILPHPEYTYLLHIWQACRQAGEGSQLQQGIACMRGRAKSHPCLECTLADGCSISAVLTLMVPARLVTSVLAASKASSCRLRLAWYACASMRPSVISACIFTGYMQYAMHMLNSIAWLIIAVLTCAQSCPVQHVAHHGCGICQV